MTATKATYISRDDVLKLMRDGYKAISYSRRVRVGARVYKPYDIGSVRENVHTNTLMSLVRDGLIRAEVQTGDETTFVAV